MFQRNAISALHDWKEKINRKPLIIRGARQVGKTTLVNDLALHIQHRNPTIFNLIII